MLTPVQIEEFQREGYLVVPDVLSDDVLAPVRVDYEALLDRLYHDWHRKGLVGEADSFQAKLTTAYSAGLDWFQPMDISLPFSTIHADTPMHFSQPVLDM
ncbi:MAG: phytanoyl-CoA dioxygenase, partial [Pseudomonadota bacterium]